MADTIRIIILAGGLVKIETDKAGSWYAARRARM